MNRKELKKKVTEIVEITSVRARVFVNNGTLDSLIDDYPQLPMLCAARIEEVVMELDALTKRAKAEIERLHSL